MSASLGRDIASEIVATPASDNVAVTAGGAGDNVLVNGRTVDRSTLNGKYESVAALVQAKATFAAAATLTIANKIQHSVDGVVWTDFVVGTPFVLTATAAGTLYGAAKLNADLNKANQYIRVAFTPDLSAAGVDTAQLASTFVFGGAQFLPTGATP